MGGSKAYPYGSTSAVRAHVLSALGVLKVASADQVRRLMCPGHKDSKAVRNACLDLGKHGLTVSEGASRDGAKLWGLTPLGLEAASEVLGRPLGEMGGTARGAGRSGAPHAMAVNETVIAITRTVPQPTRPVPRRGAPAVPAPEVELAAAPAGIGSISAWSTEAAHTLSGGGRRTAVRADAVLHAPEAGAPVLLLEVDNCTESADTLAAKFDRYRAYFRLTAKSQSGPTVPAWRTLYAPTGREGHPPVAVVFNPGSRTGEQALKARMNRVIDLTREIWSGRWEHMRRAVDGTVDGYQDYADAIPLLFTTLPRLQADGPLGEVWWRCGHRQWETLTDALDNPDGEDAWNRRAAQRLQERREQERQQREREEREQPGPLGRRRAVPHPMPMPMPVPVSEPCERCGLPVTGVPGTGDDDAPPADGRHCPVCRSDIAAQPLTLRQALFGRRT